MRLFVAVALASVFPAALHGEEDDPKMTRASQSPSAAPSSSAAPPRAAQLPSAALPSEAPSSSQLGTAPAPAELEPGASTTPVPSRPAPSQLLPDEDDPKMSRGTMPRRWWQTAHPVPRFKLTYRYLDLAGLQGGTQHFDAVGLSVYPLSSLLRIGIDAEFAWGGGPYQMWLATVGLAAGFQYPTRVTPFVDGRFVTGVVGGTVMGAAAVSWLYAGGVETGIELYYARRYFITLGIGWMHPVYGGIDVNTAIRTGALVVHNFSNDTLTFKVGLGL